MFLVALLLACVILMVALNMSACWFQNKVKLLGASHQLNWSQSDSANSLLSAQKPHDGTEFRTSSPCEWACWISRLHPHTLARWNRWLCKETVGKQAEGDLPQLLLLV